MILTFCLKRSLQQWFEYCPKGKKRNCPVCKQTCTNANVWRLYFQSIGDANDPSISQKPLDCEVNPKELQNKATRLEGKVVALETTLERQQKELKDVKNQLFACEEQLKVAMTQKTEALTQKATIQQLLRVKSEELDKSTLESMRAQQRNMALAKELAALKLASDLNLDEEEIMKLSSLGNDCGSKETVDVLRKSLIIRNKNYKELMAKCNVIGRGEARCLHKLEKANEKIMKLRLKVQELETLVEAKENEALRVLKNEDYKFTTKDPGKEENENHIDLDDSENFNETGTNLFLLKKEQLSKVGNIKGTIYDITSESDFVQNDRKKSAFINESDDMMQSSIIRPHMLSSKKVTPCSNNDHDTRTNHMARKDATFDLQNGVDTRRSSDSDGLACARAVRMNDHCKNPPHKHDTEVEVICNGEANPFQTSLQIIKETRSSISFSKGENCFYGGALGPDETNWQSGKLCKNVQNKGSTTIQGLKSATGDLIAVGPDGRGGRIKILRTLDRASSAQENNDTFSWAKKCKHGAKTSRLQPQGQCLQIEHFFQKTGQ
ncbi:hypothetical protein F511_01277 [Dorcoceras hygrometricum]|uniref:Uncharacterized protein n=1 Tax=Dorcoceras hygrometricum TaxID=472368 RepID=A0A2Z7BSM2_9LAMI|nr:hypothetical protein F511_01277 [Dorcoceras hygrometricum]